MSFTCKNCGKPLIPGNRFCSQCGLAFAPPVPPVQAAPVQPSPVMPGSPASPSPARKVNPAWIAGSVLFVAFIGIMGLKQTSGPGGSGSSTGGSGTGPPPPPPPPAYSLVGSWASDVTVGGASQHWMYTFNGDGTMLEAVTSQAGQGGGSETYTSTGDQVTVSDGKAYTEQGTVAWAGPDQFRYKITSNTEDASQVGLETVFTRQTQTVAQTQPPSTPADTTVPTSPPPASALTSDELVQASERYEGQVITVSANVQGEPDGSKLFLSKGVECDFPEGTDLTGTKPVAEAIGPLWVSHSVTVEGICRGRRADGEVWLDNCKLKSIGALTRTQ